MNVKLTITGSCKLSNKQHKAHAEYNTSFLSIRGQRSHRYDFVKYSTIRLLDARNHI